ncbi:MAG TPA: enoyl-CoA hydratase/isomerase family protein, partial [Mycobacterium sp.]|nr:enoyl-CoA hydratase/isomerase family protein [Mycobacterium sp.]
LPLLVGRSRAIEIVLGADDYDAGTAERYGWINRAIADAELDDFVANFVRRVLSFDQQALSTAKKIINQRGLPDPAQLQATEDIFFTTYQWPGATERMPKLRERGIGTPGEFELNLGRHIENL